MHFTSFNFTGQGAAPRLIVTGAVHGNETCGTQAIHRVLAQLHDGALRISAGSLTLVPVANPLAYAKGERAGERNLNRNLFPSAAPQDFEDRVANWLCPLLAQHDVLLDLHSFTAPGTPFALLGPRDNTGPLQPFAHAAQERALARRLGVRRFVEGWLQTYSRGVRRRGDREAALRHGVGTTEYMRSVGGYALTLECGQHQDAAAPQLAYQAIINALAFLGLIDRPAPPALEREDAEALIMVEVYDKVAAADAFCRPWASFDAVDRGQLIGHRADGTPLCAEFDGRILFPDSAAGAGEEWFYLARPNADFG
ncbi:succinylglutamate desuccinylase/aspartoacylase family protein [Janthinobacterium sp.]|uniref:succinylglutamate desuccinylase/aspartoacylase domain-containing protein n=1 Tax=Janthinobacterium sp. TaxID=1871054 RepID=UPI00293D4F37|nr:succinylglutamate desuccinylase/aspartoacylase family protein [Janthinobacterium sp.]